MSVLKLSKRPDKRRMAAALRLGAEWCFRSESWTGVLYGVRQGFDAYRRYMAPFCPSTGGEIARMGGAYNTEHERCLWLCMALAALQHDIDLPKEIDVAAIDAAK